MSWVKDGFYLLAGLPIFEHVHVALQSLSGVASLLESKAVAALITALGLFAARMVEVRLTNRWRERAERAEVELRGLRDGGGR